MPDLYGNPLPNEGMGFSNPNFFQGNQQTAFLGQPQGMIQGGGNQPTLSAGQENAFAFNQGIGQPTFATPEAENQFFANQNAVPASAVPQPVVQTNNILSQPDPLNVNTTTARTASFDPNDASTFLTGSNNVGGTETLGQGASVGGAQGSDSFLSGFENSDLLNFGGNLLGLGVGSYYQNQALDLQEGQLGVAQDSLALKQREYDDRMNASSASASGADAERQRLASGG